MSHTKLKMFAIEASMSTEDALYEERDKETERDRVAERERQRETERERQREEQSKL